MRIACLFGYFSLCQNGVLYNSTIEQPHSEKCLAKNKRRCKQVRTPGHQGSSTAWHMALEVCSGYDRGIQKSIATSEYINLLENYHNYMAKIKNTKVFFIFEIYSLCLYFITAGNSEIKMEKDASSREEDDFVKGFRKGKVFLP